MSDKAGFHAILENPPWEGIDTSDKEFYAGFDISILNLKSEEEIEALIYQLNENHQIKDARHKYDSDIQAYRNSTKIFFRHVNQGAKGTSGATPDMYQCFAERSVNLLCKFGSIGAVFSSAFHSVESSSGIRKLYLEKMALRVCFSFENKKRLFEIHPSFKFPVVVADKTGITDSFSCAFYLHEESWLFQDYKGDSLLTYSTDFIRKTTGELLNFLELRTQESVPIIETIYASKESTFGVLRRKWDIMPTEELHTSKQRHRTKLISEIIQEFSGDPRKPEIQLPLLYEGIIPVCKGEHFHQYDALWGDVPEVATTVLSMRGKEQRVFASGFFRMVFRRQASSTNERTVITNVSVPGILYFDSALPERDPNIRQTWKALTIVSLCNSFCFDWVLRQIVSANITFNYLDNAPTPHLKNIALLISHLALRLTCNHSGYAPLWREQLGDEWREPGKPPFTWPVLATDDERWAVRAAIDAVVAQAYGLTRDQYAHVLSTFSHKSYPNALHLCLAAFDELTAIGLDAFTRKHDPYHDIPLNESLPKPVIDLPIPATTTKPQQGSLDLGALS